MIKIAILLFGLLVVFSLSIFSPANSSAFNLFCTTDSSGACVSGPCKDNPNAPTCQQAQNEGGSNNRVTGTQNIINVAANILALVTGVAAIIMILISGLRFVTAGGASPGQRSGDPNAIKSARATLTASILGLLVVVLAWTIVRFVTDRFIN